MGIFDKFKLGLNKSSKSLSSGLNDLIFKRKIDESMLNELEDFLIQSDVGVESAKELREKFANTKVNPKTSGKDTKRCRIRCTRAKILNQHPSLRCPLNL